jgi:hypothetical protein
MTTRKRIAVWAGAGVALALVFAAYARPDMVMSLATQLWACF